MTNTLGHCENSPVFSSFHQIEMLAISVLYNDSFQADTWQWKLSRGNRIFKAIGVTWIPLCTDALPSEEKRFSSNIFLSAYHSSSIKSLERHFFLFEAYRSIRYCLQCLVDSYLKALKLLLYFFSFRVTSRKKNNIGHFHIFWKIWISSHVIVKWIPVVEELNAELWNRSKQVWAPVMLLHSFSV